MKRSLHLLIALILINNLVHAQVSAPTKRANFGVDGDLRATFFNGFVEAGSDDWFKSDAGPGTFIIDTTGASYLVSRYTTMPATKMFPFFRGMRFPQLSVVNGKLLVDGIFIRDHHGDDSTVFASSSNKNGQNPGTWTTPVSQGIPDKTDILDMFMHVRHDGPNLSDSLWLFGGVSLDQTSGNRYFDFEMYQTDITYNRPTLSFSGYGPDAGHTSWQFDAAGNIIKAGDVIFTAEFGSSSISLLEARIWINKATMSITPKTFSWGGSFDGASAGATFGYANITPKVAGDFYTGTQSGNNTWAGPFAVVLQNNTVVANYTSKQFLEFSVNLSKLGLDYMSMSADPCTMPFRRILVKSRSSTSFTAELKDFVGPFDFFRAPRATASADIPFFCGAVGVANISVNNPLITSLYMWETPDGNIVGSNIGPTITVNAPGSYIVNQQLMDSCGIFYAKDTVVVYQDLACTVLKTYLTSFAGERSGPFMKLKWTAMNNGGAKYYEIQKSTGDGKFVTIGKMTSDPHSQTASYQFMDNIEDVHSDVVYYRLKITDINGIVEYSKTIAQNLSAANNGLKIVAPTPHNPGYLVLSSDKDANASVSIYDLSGKRIQRSSLHLDKGSTIYELNQTWRLKPGVYVVKAIIGDRSYSEKMVWLK